MEYVTPEGLRQDGRRPPEARAPSRTGGAAKLQQRGTPLSPFCFPRAPGRGLSPSRLPPRALRRYASCSASSASSPRPTAPPSSRWVTRRSSRLSTGPGRCSGAARRSRTSATSTSSSPWRAPNPLRPPPLPLALFPSPHARRRPPAVAPTNHPPPPTTQAPFALGLRRKLKGRDRRLTELALVIRQTLEGAVLTDRYPRSQIDVVLQARASPPRCALSHGSGLAFAFRLALRLLGALGRGRGHAGLLPATPRDRAALNSPAAPVPSRRPPRTAQPRRCSRAMAGSGAAR